MTNEDLSPDRKFIISLHKRCKKHVENLDKKLIREDGEVDEATTSMITAYMGIIMLIEAHLTEEALYDFLERLEEAGYKE